MLPIHFDDILHPFRTIGLLSWWWYHKRGTWEQLVDTNRKRALELEWWRHFDYKLNWSHPKTFNEKVQWLEAFTDTSLWTKYSDKHEVREYIKACGFEDTLMKEYAVWDRAEDINFDALPNSFAIKCTHDYASTILVKDKSKNFDPDTITRFLHWHLKRPFGYETAEPHYTKIQPRIIAEELLPLSDNNDLVDYKILCIEGKAQLMLLCYNRNFPSFAHVSDFYSIHPWEPKRNYFSERFQHQDFKPMPRHENLERMVEMAERLSQGFHQVRVDLYNINGKIYFGEMTFTWSSGRIKNLSDEMQLRLGSMIRLPNR